MATTTIPWGDGSGDNIYLTYSSASGDQTVEVSSDANTGSARSQVVTFTSGIGSITQQLTVSQEAGGPVQHTITVYPSGYDTEHHAYYGFSNVSNAYDSGSADGYATINFTRGNGAETYVYFTFNLSSIPQNATIDSITLTAYAQVTTTAGSRLGTRVLQVCRGTDAVGTASSNMTTSKKAYTLDVGSGWTGANINDLTLKVNVFRGTQSTTTSYYCYFYGATLTVTYTA